jgi:two-component system cell cycle response regulator
MKILVVDDIPANIRLLEAKLNAEYYNVISANNGIDAIKIAEVQKPDLILLDVMMPGIDGIETCSRLKQNPSTHYIPVIMITALSDQESLVRGLQSGADEFLSKPIRDVPLFSRVRSLLRLKSLIDAAYVRSSSIETFAQLPKISLDKTKIIFYGDNYHTVNYIRETLTPQNCLIDTFERESEFKQALANDSYDIILCSHYMHGGDNLRLCSWLRSQQHTKYTPVVLVAEECDEDKLAKALELGVNDYIITPFDYHELKARLLTQLRWVYYQEHMQNVYQASIDMALTDELTGLYNRRYFSKHLAKLLQYNEREKKSEVVMMMDIDHFKSINDTFGHDAGDIVLQEVSQLMKNAVRESDFVARMGGEEFVIVMPNSRMSIGLQVAERVRSCIEAHKFIIADGREIQVTISIGVVSSFGYRDFNSDILLKAADEALYNSKTTGRNRISVGSVEKLCAHV